MSLPYYKSSYIKTKAMPVTDESGCCNHRHLREIDCSLAVVVGPAAGTEYVGKSNTCLAYSAKVCFS